MVIQLIYRNFNSSLAKRPGPESDQSPRSNTEVANEWINNSTPPDAFMTCTVINLLYFQKVTPFIFQIIYKTQNVIGKGKGKATPLQAWRGPEVSRRLRLSDFKTIGT